MITVKYNEKKFKETVNKLINRKFSINSEVEEVTKKIVNDVAKNGDKALFKYIEKFDNSHVSKDNIRIKKRDIENSYNEANKNDINEIKTAAKKITAFHKKQTLKSWRYEQADGTILGQIVSPLDKVAIYVPGGKAAYPSSVLMNAIPAKVAGVDSIYMCTPAVNEKINPYVLIAADIVGVKEIYKMGGAQAISAFSCGTATIPKVDKIVGPGNIYVAIAKRLVFGKVDIDMIAGPSEILIIADETSLPNFIAADILSQAEHDEMAIPVLISTSQKITDSVIKEINIQKKRLKRQNIIDKSLKDNFIILIVKNLNYAVEISNKFAPEHLELAVKEPFKLLELVKNAGSIFLGNYSPESLGDYAAGPNHVLPTGGTARFSSPLGVYDFKKRSSIIFFSKDGCKKIGKTVERFSLLEGLDAHANAMKIRIE